MILYHGTSSDNRDSILKSGLLREHSYSGGIFFSTLPGEHDVSRSYIDVWQVDTSGLELERDSTTDHEDSDPWYVLWYADVLPTRLTLLKAGLRDCMPV